MTENERQYTQEFADVLKNELAAIHARRQRYRQEQPTAAPPLPANDAATPAEQARRAALDQD